MMKVIHYLQYTCGIRSYILNGALKCAVANSYITDIIGIDYIPLKS